MNTTKTKRDEHEGCCEEKHVKELLLHMQRSVDRIVRKKTSIEHIWDSWMRKILKSRAWLNTKFVKFKDDYLYSSASEDDKDNTEGQRVKKAAVKSPAKNTRKKQKSVKCNSSIPEDESMHPPPPPPTEEPTTEEAPDVAKGDFPMEPEYVNGHTSTPADSINEADVIDIFSTP
ncbi:hypothetical protein MRB53_004450 [Persea americana]|uniref:Uncharacterized protein n=1 Tax=Persea americana TaxID=3435 RepID=A0ACC2MA92_PERAE|nr:hypothetical protein MRB53_004450 [Persea americana]